MTDNFRTGENTIYELWSTNIEEPIRSLRAGIHSSPHAVEEAPRICTLDSITLTEYFVFVFVLDSYSSYLTDPSEACSLAYCIGTYSVLS